MTQCYQPYHIWKIRDNASYEEKITWSYAEAKKIIGNPPESNIRIRCGKCLACLKKKQNEWIVRNYHEKLTNKKCMMINLTYNDENIPNNKKLNHRDFQLFMKRLRKKYTGVKIKYYMAGEYGKEKNRPHYHALIYGIKFNDMVKFQKKKKYWLYRSKELESLWTLGFSTIGECTNKSISYVTKYIIKSKYNIKKEDKYIPYTKMSTKTAIGYEYLIRRIKNIAQNGTIKITKYTYAIPTYYIRKMKDIIPKWYQKRKEEIENYILELEEDTELKLKNIKIALESKWRKENLT